MQKWSKHNFKTQTKNSKEAQEEEEEEEEGRREQPNENQSFVTSCHTCPSSSSSSSSSRVLHYVDGCGHLEAGSLVAFFISLPERIDPFAWFSLFLGNVLCEGKIAPCCHFVTT